MSTPRAAKRYAKSLFSLSEERGAMEHMEKDVQRIQGVIANSKDLGLLLRSPVVKADAKEKILALIFEQHISELTMEFMRILVRKGRESILPTLSLIHI